MKTAITARLGIDAPLLGFSRSPDVVREVSLAGGLGVFAASHYSPGELDDQLTRLDRELGGRPYGIDVVMPARIAADAAEVLTGLRTQIPERHTRFVERLLDDHEVPPIPAGTERPTSSIDDLAAALAGGEQIDAILDVVFSHRIALVANALGPAPPALVERARAGEIPVAALVGDPRHAVRQLEAGVDVLVAQGTEAGGHTGLITTMVLTPEVVAIAGETPVLAAGGISSGAQMAAALALGAARRVVRLGVTDEP